MFVCKLSLPSCSHYEHNLSLDPQISRGATGMNIIEMGIQINQTWPILVTWLLTNNASSIFKVFIVWDCMETVSLGLQAGVPLSAGNFRKDRWLDKTCELLPVTSRPILHPLATSKQPRLHCISAKQNSQSHDIPGHTFVFHVQSLRFVDDQSWKNTSKSERGFVRHHHRCRCNFRRVPALPASRGI